MAAPLLSQQLTTDSIDRGLGVGSAKLWADPSTLTGVQAPKGQAYPPLGTSGSPPLSFQGKEPSYRRGTTPSLAQPAF